MRDVNLKMTEEEFESFFAMAEENAISIGNIVDEEDNMFGVINEKGLKL